MAKDVLRLSQVVGLFGPGAMVDLPDRSVIVSGLDDWDMKGPQAFRPIEEPRLTEVLRERLTQDGRWPAGRPLSLRTPPLGNSDPRLSSPTMRVRVFPTWFTCEEPSAEDARRRRLVRWSELDPLRRRDWIDDAGKRQAVTPIRFVCGCQNGHLQDIDWKWVIHGEAACQKPMSLQEYGTSAEPRDTRVQCGCKKSIGLDELFIKGRLGKCHGSRPWIGDREEGCDSELKLLTRSATNTYFAQVATVISLPKVEDNLTTQIMGVHSRINWVEEPKDVAKARKSAPEVAAALQDYSDEEVFARLQQLQVGLKETAAKDPRIAEFELLASGRPVIGENRPDAKLHAETLPRAVWDPDSDLVCEGIASLVAVHRLREVCCLYGFTRFEPSPLADDGLEDIGLAIRGASLGVGNDWLPAVEQFGEGLFIQFSPQKLQEWLDRGGTRARLQQMADAAMAWSVKNRQPVGFRSGGLYMLAHSLSHALMIEIALDCGYPATALKERIYALPRLNPADPLRCGLVIYTATAGIQGTLGGLVEVASRFRHVLRSALEHLQICSGDPICADHDPTTRTDDRALHGAACHGCMLVAETSCEARNLHLDRALLAETMATAGAGYFDLRKQETVRMPGGGSVEGADPAR
jgi:hypothetical protein